MIIAVLIHLLHLLGVLHLFQVPDTAFCFTGRTLVHSGGHAYCLPTRALELWRQL